MSDTEHREADSAAQAEPIASSPITTDANAAAPAAPAPAPQPRIADSTFEAAHAELPPLSAIGGDSAAPETTESGAAAPSGARRGRGRGAPAGKFGAPGATQKSPIGAVENPSDMTESLSGKHIAGYGDAKPAEAPAEPKPERTAGPKEFVPPVSEGVFKAELNPEAERRAREERRRQRTEQRPQGEQPQQPRAERQGDGPRPPREDRRQGGENREQGRRDERRPDRPKPGRLTIEAPKIPVTQELSLFGKVKRAIARLFGVPARDEVKYESTSKKPTPHSRDWKPTGQNDERRGKGDFRHGNHRGGDNRGNPNRDGRHRPHQRGGNHHGGFRDGGNRQG